MHDLGKAATPAHVLPSHHGHEDAGVALVEQLRERAAPVVAEGRGLGAPVRAVHKGRQVRPQVVAAPPASDAVGKAALSARPEMQGVDAPGVLQSIGHRLGELQPGNRHPALQGKITLQTIDEIGRKVPLLIDLKPSGENYMTEFHNAGGMLALLHTLRPLLHLEA
ncbi:hypothetical protein B4Q13_21325, partial [Lacticaseibacillus rhamnosus]